MPAKHDWSPRERALLILIAAFGGLGLNGVFLYVAFARPDRLRHALADPVAWALMAEALVVTGLLAWVFARRGIGRLGPFGFIALSLAGGLACSIPLALLGGRRESAHDA